MNLEKRIQNLELRLFGDPDDHLVTWEEFSYFFGTTHPEHRNDVSHLVDMPRILSSRPTRKVRRLIREFYAKSAKQQPPPTAQTAPTEEGK